MSASIGITRELQPPVEDQPVNLADLQPTYARQIHHEDDANTAAVRRYAACIHNIGSCIGAFGAVPCCFMCPNPYKPVSQGEVGLIQKFGRFDRSVDPGLVKVNPLSERLSTVNVKIQNIDVPRQACMTNDYVNLNLTSTICYQVISPHKAAFGNSNIKQELVYQTQTALRDVISAKTLQDVINCREEIVQSASEIIQEAATSWGTQVKSVRIMDVILSGELPELLPVTMQPQRILEYQRTTGQFGPPPKYEDIDTYTNRRL